MCDLVCVHVCEMALGSMLDLCVIISSLFFFSPTDPLLFITSAIECVCVCRERAALLSLSWVPGLSSIHRNITQGIRAARSGELKATCLCLLWLSCQNLLRIVYIFITSWPRLQGCHREHVSFDIYDELWDLPFFRSCSQVWLRLRV